MTAPELKPCPFCGGRNVGWDWVSTYSTDSSYAFFGCLDCRIGSNEADEDNTMHPADVSAWNTRAPDPDKKAAKARVKELEAALREIEADRDTACFRALPATDARADALREALAVAMEECWKEREMKLAGRIEKRILAMISANSRTT